MGRPVRERLLEVILRYQRRVISRFYLMAKAVRECGRTGKARPCKSAEWFDSKWVRSEQGALPIPPRDADHSRKADRVQSSTGSWNVCWRREPPGGNTEEPERDNLRVSAETAEREKLNDERGIKPLPVSRSRDGAESGRAVQDG